MTDITPLIPAGRKIIESYGNGSFKVSGERYECNLVIFPDAVQKLQADNIPTLNENSIKIIFDNADNVEVLLVGGGERAEYFSRELETKLNQKNVAVEYMTTGAAARTYNVLLSEERKVAVVLIAV